jgi:hypothetical protein
MTESVTELYDEVFCDEVPDAALEIAGSKMAGGAAASVTLAFCSGLDTCPASPRNKIVYIDWGRFIRRPRFNDLCCSVATRLRMSALCQKRTLHLPIRSPRRRASGEWAGSLGGAPWRFLG